MADEFVVCDGDKAEGAVKLTSGAIAGAGLQQCKPRNGSVDQGLHQSAANALSPEFGRNVEAAHSSGLARRVVGIDIQSANACQLFLPAGC